MRMAHDIVLAYYAHPDGLERDRLGRPGEPARLCAHGLRRARSVGGGRSQATATSKRRDGRTAVSDDPFATPRARRRAARPTCSGPAPGCRCGNIGDDEAVDFVDRRHRRGRRNAGLQARRRRLFGRGARCRPLFPAAGGFRLRRTRADQALLDRRAHRRRRQPAADGQQQQRQGGRRLHRPFRHGVAALPAGMVQVAQRARLWRRLAARLARDVELLHRGRAGAEHLRAGDLSLGSAASALSVSRARTQCRRAARWPEAARRWACNGRRRRLATSRRRADCRHLASIAASA